MIDSANRLHRWIFLLTAGFLFVAVTLRSVIGFADEAFLVQVLALLLAWLGLFVLEALVTPRWPSLFPVYLLAQTAIVVALLALTGSTRAGDFYAILFGVMSMQAMQRLGGRVALLWIALFTPLTALTLSLDYGVGQAVAFAAVYTGVDVLLASFTLSTRRAAEARAHNQLLLEELQVANAELEAFSRQAERLAAAKERHRLARELHDSVTQTVFSMNLTAQSAALLLPRDAAAADAQLERLEDLGLTALAEIRALGSELAEDELGAHGLVGALRCHLDDRVASDGLVVTLAVEGEDDRTLTVAEELCLLRVSQEALNNIVKHAGVREAVIRLRLSPPRRLEIEDHGVGFARREGEERGGMGLRGMRERAGEIGWTFAVTSAPGAGTRVVVRESFEDEA